MSKPLGKVPGLWKLTWKYNNAILSQLDLAMIEPIMDVSCVKKKYISVSTLSFLKTSGIYAKFLERYQCLQGLSL